MDVWIGKIRYSVFDIGRKLRFIYFAQAQELYPDIYRAFFIF
jgi:hypothetical protein